MKEKMKIINSVEEENEEDIEETRERVEEKVGVGVNDLDDEEVKELGELL